MLDTPDDAGPQAQELLVKSRVGRWHLNEMYNSYREKMRTDNQQRQEREEISAVTRKSGSDTTQGLSDDGAAEANWPEFVENPERVFNITGAAYNKGKLGHVDKSFALRYGLDVTSKQRLEADHREAAQELRRRRTYGLQRSLCSWPSRSTTIVTAWASGIASADPVDNTHFKHERKLAPACGKDRIELAGSGVHKKIQNLF